MKLIEIKPITYSFFEEESSFEAQINWRSLLRKIGILIAAYHYTSKQIHSIYLKTNDEEDVI